MRNYQEIQQIRKDLIRFQEQALAGNPSYFRPNSKRYRQYIDMLTQGLKELTPYQLYAVIGLLMSDASLQQNSRGSACRIKMQQSEDHKAFIEHVLHDVFPEWTLQQNPQHPSAKRLDMWEIQTVTHVAFMLLVELMYSDLSGKRKKVIKKEIIRYLHPITIAYWFMGDGGKYDYKGNNKGLMFHTQGFDEVSVNILAQALRDRYGWNISLKPERRAENQWAVAVDDCNYEDFISKVGPYVHQSMISKLPIPRSLRSRKYNPLTSISKVEFDLVCGSFFF